MSNHVCSHETCSIKRTGDTLIITCQVCGLSDAYPLDGGEPFAPRRRRVPLWAGCLVLIVGAVAAVTAIALLTMFAVR